MYFCLLVSWLSERDDDGVDVVEVDGADTAGAVSIRSSRLVPAILSANSRAFALIPQHQC